VHRLSWPSRKGGKL